MDHVERKMLIQHGGLQMPAGTCLVTQLKM